jgi:hypothetical protein
MTLMWKSVAMGQRGSGAMEQWQATDSEAFGKRVESVRSQMGLTGTDYQTDDDRLEEKIRKELERGRVGGTDDSKDQGSA